MFCPNCARKIPENCKFCSACGTNLTEFSEKVMENEGQKERPITFSEIPHVQPEPILPKKRKNFRKFVGIVAVIVITAFLTVTGILSGISNRNNACVYFSDGDFELITNLNKETTIEIASGKSEGVRSDLVSFSPDGKYVYYIVKYDSASGTGTLCKAEYKKLKENTEKNDRYIETVAMNVYPGFSFMNNGALLYRNGACDLCYYNGKENIRLAKSVDRYYTDGIDRIVYETGDSLVGYTLYGLSLSTMDEEVKLASDYDYLYAPDTLDYIYYTKKRDSENSRLYVTGFGKDSEKLGDNAEILGISADGTIYFTLENGTMINFYDYVSDNLASADAAVTEPNLEDYSSPEYSYDMLSNREMSESDYDELYTSCTKSLYWYGESYFWSCSMEESLDEDWGDSTDAVHAATRSFIERFADTADKDGYILVTDEVKAALKQINNADDNDSEWMWLCFSREQAGESYDYGAYDEAYEAYEAAKRRNEIREMLQNDKNAYAVSTLYCYSGGTLTTINDQVLEAVDRSGGIVFNTPELITEKINIEDVTATVDVMKLFHVDYTAQNYLVPVDGTNVYQMSEKAVEIFYDSDGGAPLFYTVGSDLYMRSSSIGLYAAEISGEMIDHFSLIADDVDICIVGDDALYYTKDMYTGSYGSCCDLYSYKNGKSTGLAQGIAIDAVNDPCLYNDDAVLAYTGYGAYGYELTLFEKDGRKTIIGDDVRQFIRVDQSALLYISDNDLYLYDGKERSRIRNDVDYLWSLNKMKNLLYD